MLKLGRCKGESILIGENIRIYIESVDGKYVKLGVDAPRDIVVLRGELKSNTRKKDGDHYECR